VARPIKELRGFQRVSLAAGESKTATFTLDARQLAYYGDGGFVIEPGTVQIMIGSSSADVRLTVTFRIK
jgi:beta-glucosidase